MFNICFAGQSDLLLNQTFFEYNSTNIRIKL